MNVNIKPFDNLNFRRAVAYAINRDAIKSQLAVQQSKIEQMQASLETQVIDVSSGGGAVQIKINGAGKFLALTLDPEFLKEDANLVADSVLAAVQDAAKQAKDYNDAEMAKVTAAFQAPGLF